VKRLLFLLPAALFGLVVIAFTVSLGHDPSKLPSMLIGKPLPSFALPALQPTQAGLSSTDLRGEPLLLNVFASWCVSCRLEHPMLMRLQAEGVAVDGLDWKDDPADGAKWLADNGDPYRRVGNDLSGRTGIDLGVTGAPETFVIDRLGRVRYKHIGPIEADDWTRTLQPLLLRLKAES
jgi:cytochrome c biogenesis protein CcmG/thiol:disulfide interchange protein DsbE